MNEHRSRTPSLLKQEEPAPEITVLQSFQKDYKVIALICIGHKTYFALNIPATRSTCELLLLIMYRETRLTALSSLPLLNRHDAAEAKVVGSCINLALATRAYHVA
jgi:hypothetical protein